LYTTYRAVFRWPPGGHLQWQLSKLKSDEARAQSFGISALVIAEERLQP